MIMKKLFQSIGKGALRGFPMIQGIVQEIKNRNNPIAAPGDDGATKPAGIDWVSIIIELAVVYFAIQFVKGNITIDQLTQIIPFITGR